VQVQLNMWLAGYYADPSVSLDAFSEQLAAWLVSCGSAVINKIELLVTLADRLHVYCQPQVGVSLRSSYSMTSVPLVTSSSCAAGLIRPDAMQQAAGALSCVQCVASTCTCPLFIRCLQDTHKQQQGEPSSPAYTAAAINHGILLFVQQQHAKALAVLEPLYTSVEAMHGGAALCLCVLLLEIYLSSGQLPKAAQVLHYLQSSNSPGAPVRAAFSDDVGDEAASSHAHDAEHGQQLQQQLQASPKQSPVQQQLQQQQQQLMMSPKRPSPMQQPSPRQSPRTVYGTEQQSQQQQQQQGEQQPEMPVSLDLPMVTRCTSAFMQQVRAVCCRALHSVVAVMHVPASTTDVANA
jgi:hypothetical protein